MPKFRGGGGGLVGEALCVCSIVGISARKTGTSGFRDRLGSYENGGRDVNPARSSVLAHRVEDVTTIEPFQFKYVTYNILHLPLLLSIWGNAHLPIEWNRCHTSCERILDLTERPDSKNGPARSLSRCRQCHRTCSGDEKAMRNFEIANYQSSPIFSPRPNWRSSIQLLSTMQECRNNRDPPLRSDAATFSRRNVLSLERERHVILAPRPPADAVLLAAAATAAIVQSEYDPPAIPGPPRPFQG